MRIRTLLLALAGSGLLLPSGVGAVELFALSDFLSTESRLYRIDTVTLATTLVGDTQFNQGYGLGDYNGRLFSFSQTPDEVVELNPATAATELTFNIGIPALGGEGGISFDSSGKGYIAHANGAAGDLYSFDIGGSSSTRIGDAGDLVPSMDGLDFNSSGVLYGYSQASDPDEGSLYTISTLDASTTLIGTPSALPDGLAGLTFDADDNLYAITRSGGLWSLDASDGTGTLLGSTGLSQVSGLSALRPIPEPSTLGLLGLCLAGLALGRRRKQRS